MCPLCERGQPEDLHCGVDVAGADAAAHKPGPPHARGQPLLSAREKTTDRAAHLPATALSWSCSGKEVSV